MHVAVIGAGMAGLAAAKNLLQFGLKVTVFEQDATLGGTWNYTDEIGKNEYGLDIHTSMYRNLYTNFPKEVMGYPDFPIPDQENSFISQADVLNFLDLYADHFDVKHHIKFLHHVIRVRPIEDTKWEVIVQDLPNNTYETLEFDAIMVCNGHYHTASIPDLPGRDIFKGKQMHSHDYRHAEPFKNEKVLVIGAGPSGSDIANDISKYANRVTLSRHITQSIKINYTEKVNLKPDVKCLTESGAIFIDGTTQSYTSIFYCTGFKFTFPFLSVDCGIDVDENFVQPLYKHCININHPTMSIIGLPFHLCIALACDMQSKFFLKYLTGEKQWPSKEEMQNDTKQDMEKRWSMGTQKKHAHKMGDLQVTYFEDLASSVDLERIPPVIDNVCTANLQYCLSDMQNYRKKKYNIIDDDTFVVT